MGSRDPLSFEVTSRPSLPPPHNKFVPGPGWVRVSNEQDLFPAMEDANLNVFAGAVRSFPLQLGNFSQLTIRCDLNSGKTKVLDRSSIGTIIALPALETFLKGR